jgi:SAM-dependent methyltransferase
MITFRHFDTYLDYTYLQGGKARSMSGRLLEGQKKRIRGFSKVFQMLRKHCAREAFLCLGARTGAENIAASFNGFPDSVGIDLHPIGDSVIKADWHSLPFSDKSFGNIYTNCLDHCFDLTKLGREILRVLKDDGVFILQASDSEEWKSIPIEHRMRKGYEAMFWDRSCEICEELVSLGFTWKCIERRGSITTYLLRKAITK